MSLYRKVTKNLAHLFSGGIARETVPTALIMTTRVFIQTISLVLITKALTTSEFATLTAVAGIAIIFGSAASLGTHIALIASISKNNNLAQFYAKALPITLTFGMLLLLFWSLIIGISDLLSQVNFGSILMIAISEIIVQPIIVLVSSELIYKGRTSLSQTLTLTPLVLRVISMGIITYYGLVNNFELVCYIWIFSTLSILTIITLQRIPSWPPPREWCLPNINEIRELAGYASINFTQITSMEIDKPLAVKLLPPELAGTYTICSRVIYATAQPISALILSSLPKLYKYSSLTKSKKLVGLILATSFVYGIFACLAIRQLIPYLENFFPDSYASITIYFYTMSLAIPFLSIRVASINIIMASCTPWIRVKCESISIVLNITLCTFGAIYNGLSGFIAGYIAYEFIGALLNYRYIYIYGKSITNH